MMKTTVTRESQLDLRDPWRTGSIEADNVRDEAEAMWGAYEWPDLPRTDPASIPIEVLSQLSILDHQHITRDHIPVLVEFLTTPPGEEPGGWVRFATHMDAIAERA